MTTRTEGTDRRGIWKWLALAALVALLLLFIVILPAEYGYDPTRLGGKLGLTSLTGAQSGQEQSLDQVIEDLISNENLAAPANADPQQPIPLPNPSVSQIEGSAPKSETMRIQLDLDGKTEVKVQMRKSKMVLYSWKVTGGEVYVDFHGHDPAKGKDFWVRYEEAGQEPPGATERSGSLVAPFDGQHGWFWLNISEQPITIDLTVTGYFDQLVDLGLIQ
jgi:hypothetical protein